MVRFQLKGRGIRDRLVLDAMGRVPRERFVPIGLEDRAYLDGPLSIGCGQTISQPYMVGIMTESLQLEKKDKVLEIGTGSGYQTAVLAEIADQVYSIERQAELAHRAEDVLQSLGYKNIHVFTGDGTVGLEDKAPFDAIIVTAGAPAVPESLKSQLKEGGRLVIPVGDHFMQSLLRITRRGEFYDQENLLGCVFVPLIGAEGWADDGRR